MRSVWYSRVGPPANSSTRVGLSSTWMVRTPLRCSASAVNSRLSLATRATAFHSPWRNTRLPDFFDGSVNASGTFSGSMTNSAVPCGGEASPANFKRLRRQVEVGLVRP